MEQTPIRRVFSGTIFLLNGATATLNITATVNAAGDYENVAEVTTSDQADPDSDPNNDDGDQSEDDEDNATPQIADLELAKSVVVNGDGTVTFRIIVTNTGPDAATGVAVADTLPAGYTYVSDVASQGAYSSVTGIWTIGAMALNEMDTLDITVTVNASGDTTNVAQVSASEPL